MRQRHCPKRELCRVVNCNPALGWALGSSAVHCLFLSLMAAVIKPQWIKRVNFKYSGRKKGEENTEIICPSVCFSFGGFAV